jgi:hypothetical protein
MQSSSEKFKLAHRSYAEALRFIGQTLPKFRPELLEIELSNDVYQIRGRTHEPIHQAASQSHKSLPPSLGENACDAKQPLQQAFTLQYTADDIVKLSKEWKAKRHDVGKMPDIHDLAELLRTIGSDLDGSGRSLLKITWEGLKLVVLFQEREGNTGTREYDLLFLSKKQKEIASDRLSRASVQPWKDWDR